MVTTEKTTPTKKKKSKFQPRLLKGRGQAHIKSTYNNTIVSISDMNGNVICWSTSGRCGFKSAKKSTPYAAGVVVKTIAPQAKEAGIKEVDVLVRGIGPAREAAMRALAANGIQIVSIKDVTPVPHNGCRPKKPRRV
ncbi:30S ribosomal protein S11 [Candidatus Kuenenbacteria bacterium CG_4_9_14_3_um_filter_39_14]|uniref:Small ribosomal subunit protein uS11 n=6 Tax=Candidatus Kueneniibacteriota TaxID=1752740 RepID=A0A2M7IML8_9BACT|nr:30S ribosomal protein S11 [Candidatus Kuenenbacteria bacterium]OIP56406.1 MAG: 30S ribosomal protein S11 [Candidatus Kuenenbacteria bacterium CG2_30_39_24]PIP75193.1 MAG: 30S ribosomal protein S11 [Candidatus Kuenenbacteria bacterium CG22_combo_CG10-13_8_21_14_all_39_9]PIW96044.1 MAG: 30S ribosomal protein S11 [Candidatus Kuenenbacteria bacterium CG_4_8_14_3_um_filter_39_15]PIX92503.1 MAG: 30S ribosomal protein S11 [Candidatus Kuenenbacteria bacterium CG_4_10_14_3_um_filter_39_14]PJA92411.1